MAPESVFEDTKLAFVLPTMQLGVIASESEIDQKPVQVDETDLGKQITGKNKDEVEVSEETGRSESESESCQLRRPLYPGPRGPRRCKVDGSESSDMLCEVW